MSDDRAPKEPVDPNDEDYADRAAGVRAGERSGLEALEAGRYEDAEKLLLEAVRGYEELGDHKSTNSAAYYLGVAMAEQGKISKALRVWEEVVDRGLDSPSAFTRLIRHYEGQDDREEVSRLVERLNRAASERTGEFFADIGQSRRASDVEDAWPDTDGRPRALIADDEPGIRQVIRQVLAGIGYEVVEAKDGSQALGVILALPVHLIVIDVFMPGHTGLDVLYRARAEGVGAPAIVISGRGDEQMVRDAERLGAKWLGKPFSVDVLSEIAKGFLQDRG